VWWAGVQACGGSLVGVSCGFAVGWLVDGSAASSGAWRAASRKRGSWARASRRHDNEKLADAVVEVSFAQLAVQDTVATGAVAAVSGMPQ
jgi:hypothetical protein